jgi:ATP-dependent DNA helicase 2 subunit 2
MLIKVVSAIVVAMDMITKFCLKYKFRKNIIAITAGELDTDFDGVTEIAGHLKSEDILLTVMYA